MNKNSCKKLVNAFFELLRRDSGKTRGNRVKFFDVLLRRIVRFQKKTGIQYFRTQASGVPEQDRRKRKRESVLEKFSRRFLVSTESMHDPWNCALPALFQADEFGVRADTVDHQRKRMLFRQFRVPEETDLLKREVRLRHPVKSALPDRRAAVRDKIGFQRLEILFQKIARMNPRGIQHGGGGFRRFLRIREIPQRENPGRRSSVGMGIGEWDHFRTRHACSSLSSTSSGTASDPPPVPRRMEGWFFPW